MAPFSARSCRFTALGLSAVVMVMSVDSSGMRAAGPIQVNSTAIVVNAGDGRCTLPGAIRSANMNTASGGVPSECAAGVAGLDTITLPAGTYTLTAIHATFPADMGLLAISTPIEIVGESAATTIIERSSTAPNMVIFFTTGNLTLTRATVRNARWPPRGGSAIATGSAQTTIIDCVFSGNSSDWGGAVYSHQGRVTVRGSRFEGNTARVRGGAVYAQNGLTIENSVFASNGVTAGTGGAVEVGSGLRPTSPTAPFCGMLRPATAAPSTPRG